MGQRQERGSTVRGITLTSAKPHQTLTRHGPLGTPLADVAFSGTGTSIRHQFESLGNFRCKAFKPTSNRIWRLASRGLETL
jgi:hypothetical protein